MLEPMIQATELAKMLKCDVRSIKTAVRKGQLQGKEICSMLYITESSVTDYQNGKDTRQVRMLKEQVQSLTERIRRQEALMQNTGATLLKGVTE